MNFVYLTSTAVRHKAFVKHLSAFFPPALIVMEPKKSSGAVGSAMLNNYAEGLKETERSFFPQAVGWEPPGSMLETRPGGINDEPVREAIRSTNPDWLLVFGTSILGNDLLSVPKHHSLNIHTGLTQSFRGVDSSFWAIYDEMPQAIGTTVHLVDAKIDTGDVLLQGRPQLDPQDSLQTIFLKTVELGFNLMKDSLSGVIEGRLAPKMLPNKGKLYQSKHFTEAVLEEVLSKKTRVIQRYLQDKEELDKQISLVNGL
ncbi:MAG: hypothetical protein KIT08_06040 [Anaerolineales bacterium]|nr:MAG: hypothetical protein KIT08_06040 [Anaerolineales bacterium]